MTRHCVVCEAPIGRLDTVCSLASCMERWRMWREEAANRVATHAGRPRYGCAKCGAERANNAIGPGLCTVCTRERAAERKQPRRCDGCGLNFIPKTRVQVRCSLACRVAVKAAVDSTRVRNRKAERGGRAKRAAAKQPPRIPCASCEHGRTSRTSDTGFTCDLQASLRCRPYGPAALYVSWEAQANG